MEIKILYLIVENSKCLLLYCLLYIETKKEKKNFIKKNI